VVILGSWQGRPVTLSIKANCITLSVDRPEEASVVSFDLEGRLWTAFLGGRSYRRGLDGSILAKWRVPGNERERCWLSEAEAQLMEAESFGLLRGLLGGVANGQVAFASSLPQDALPRLHRLVDYDGPRRQADVATYHQLYKPVGILPPDQYMAVVLQAAEGCSFNTCTFCTFYKDRPFRIKAADEFRAHAEGVRDFLGAGLSLRRTVFLADANALVIPMPRLLQLMEITNEVYDVTALGGIYAFLDGFSGEKKTSADYRKLHQLGLQRVYIGLESGNSDLLKFLRKPGKAADAVKAVRQMKDGGVAVGIIVLLGAGGHQYARQHIEDTADAINAMRLDMDDIVYFSELVTSDEMAYAADAFREGVCLLTAHEVVGQQAAIESRLRFSISGGAPHLSRYHIREFVY
jgi:hypothetical protein